MVRLRSPRTGNKVLNSRTYPLALSLVEGFLKLFIEAGALNNIPERKRDYYLERRYPSFGNLLPEAPSLDSYTGRMRGNAGADTGALQRGPTFIFGSLAASAHSHD